MNLCDREHCARRRHALTNARRWQQRYNFSGRTTIRGWRDNDAAERNQFLSKRVGLPLLYDPLTHIISLRACLHAALRGATTSHGSCLAADGLGDRDETDHQRRKADERRHWAGQRWPSLLLS
jgi:hypothetical protein